MKQLMVMTNKKGNVKLIALVGILVLFTAVIYGFNRIEQIRKEQREAGLPESVRVGTNGITPINKYDAQRRVDINNIRISLERYFSDNGLYPVDLGGLTPKYISTIPLDPATKRSFQYQVSVNGASYTIEAVMDDGSIKKFESPK